MWHNVDIVTVLIQYIFWVQFRMGVKIYVEHPLRGVSPWRVSSILHRCGHFWTINKTMGWHQTKLFCLQILGGHAPASYMRCCCFSMAMVHPDFSKKEKWALWATTALSLNLYSWLHLIHHTLNSARCLIRTISLDTLHWLPMLKGTLNSSPRLIRTKNLYSEGTN